jgi:hypothetical protein
MKNRSEQDRESRRNVDSGEEMRSLESSRAPGGLDEGDRDRDPGPDSDDKSTVLREPVADNMAIRTPGEPPTWGRDEDIF